MSGKKRLGLFGGTFDPPHVGHLILAAEARDQLNLDCTIWVLTPDPPHKRGKRITSTAHRRTMVEMSIATDKCFSLSLVDVNRPGPHYTVDTVKILKQQYPDHALFYLMGGDSLQDLPTWYQSDELLTIIDGIGVMRRPDDDIDLTSLVDALPMLPKKLNFVTAPLLEISAEQIRRRARENRTYRYYLLPAIYDYIESHRIYQA